MSITEAPVTGDAQTAAPEAPEPSGRERRESERAISYWEKKIEKLGKSATVAALDLGEINSKDWAHRFVIAVDPVVENSSLLLYGSDFAKLLQLPPKGTPHVPMVRQLPRHLSRVFMQGCGDAHNQRSPIRLEGEAPRDDGRTELYRAAFIPVGVKENSLTHLAFGAFNSCVVERAAA
ncbi:MAG: hypothetical protein JO032_13440 [Alphaproteobacteria bacterium]|nr:hypothetical protein [Alphaproteobacteria bacterium]